MRGAAPAARGLVPGARPAPAVAPDGGLSAPTPSLPAFSTSFRVYLACRFCTGTAITLLRSAVFWHVFALSGSNAAVGTVGLVQFLPALALTLVGGAIADAYDRLRIMRLAQLPYLASAALLVLASQSDVVSVPLIYGAVFANAVAAAFDNPARQALLPSLVPLAAFPRAVTISSTAMALALASGPALAGLLIWAFGVEAAYAAYGVLVAANWLGLRFVRPVRAVQERRAASWQAVREGLAFVRASPVVLGCMALDLFAVVLGSATALLPVYANDILRVGPRGYGLLASSLELGALAMSIVLVLRRPIERAGPALLAAVAVYGVATVAFGLSRWFPLSVGLYMLVGAADQISVVLRQTAVQLSTPDALRGRVSAVNMVFIHASNQLGAAESGYLAAWTSPTFTVVVGGLGVLAVVLWATLRLPALRRYRIHPGAAQ